MNQLIKIYRRGCTAITRIKKEPANEMIKKILTNYEDRILAKNLPIGKKVQEGYDITKIIPSKKYFEI